MNESTQPYRLIRIFPALAAMALATLVACGGGTRDYVLVIDTSGSMSVGKQKTIQKVRTSMESFMQTVNPGDTVTLLGFDESTRNIGTFKINSEADRSGPVQAVQNLDAWGSHTYMKSMVASVREKVGELEGKGRNVIVVIMSDGKDDPPPSAGKNRLQLSEIEAPAADREVNDTFIYYVSLGKLKDPNLEAELKTLSPSVKTIERKKDSAKGEKSDGSGAKGSAAAVDGSASGSQGGDAAANAKGAEGASGAGDAGTAGGEAGGDESQAAADEIGLSEVAEDIADRSWYEKLKSIGKIAAPIIFGILLLVWLYRKWKNRHKVSGMIQYYEADVGSPIKNDFSLNKTGKSAIEVGSKVGADLKVRQSGLPRNVTLKAYSKGGEDFLKPGSKDDAFFKFMTRQQDDLISKGDKFRLGNYVFEYGDGEK
ncbi:MAG: VWA domain-containing protein [bacterium]|nr:VWA domain-containing protein [bacterium]